MRQAEARGLGHAVLCARAAVGDEPFAVLLGDDLLDAKVPGIGQLVEVYQRLGTGVIALKEVPADQTHLYGIVDGARDGAAASRSTSWSRSRRRGRQLARRR